MRVHGSLCCFASTKTVRLIRTGSPWRPSGLSHSSRTPFLLKGVGPPLSWSFVGYRTDVVYTVHTMQYDLMFKGDPNSNTQCSMTWCLKETQSKKALVWPTQYTQCSMTWCLKGTQSKETLVWPTQYIQCNMTWCLKGTQSKKALVWPTQYTQSSMTWCLKGTQIEEALVWPTQYTQCHMAWCLKGTQREASSWALSAGMEHWDVSEEVLAEIEIPGNGEWE